MKRSKPKHLNVIINSDDEFGEHPNLVIREDGEYKGYTITHRKEHPQYERMKTEEWDYVKKDKTFIVHNTFLTTHSNNLDSDKTYPTVARVSDNLLSKFIQFLISKLK